MKFFKILASIALAGIAVSTAGLAYQSLNNSNKDNSDKVVDNSNNNDNNNSGNTTNVSAYSNLVVSEQAPEDTNSIWVKSNNNITDVEKRTTVNFSTENNASLVKQIDLVNNSNCNLTSGKMFVMDNFIYSIKPSGDYLIVNKYNGVENITNNLEVVNKNNTSICHDDNYIYITSFNSYSVIYVYKLDFDLNLITSRVIENTDSSVANRYQYLLNSVCVNNNIYVFDYYYRSIVKIDFSNGTISQLYNGLSSSYKEDLVINYYDDNYIYFTHYNYFYKFNLTDYSVTQINIKFNMSYGGEFKYYCNGYLYRYFINSKNDYSTGSSITKYFLCEEIYDEYGTLIESNNFNDYLFNSYTLSTNYFDYFTGYIYDNADGTYDLYFVISYGAGMGLYKITKEKSKLDSNKLVIVDGQYSYNFSNIPIYIKFNNLFSYTLYKPRFFTGDMNGYVKEVFAYKYNTSTLTWESI